MTDQHSRAAPENDAANGLELDWRQTIRFDLVSGLVVFLVALPLCLGIAFASGAPPVSGLLAGVIGGVIIAPVSRANLAVSGPAAGLIVIVTGAIAELGSLEGLFTAVCLAGLLQILLGFLRAGVIAHFFPASVIKGMLAGIGVVVLLKQLPHAVGFDEDFEGDVFFEQIGGGNTLTGIAGALQHIHWGATLVTAVGLAIVILWQRVPALKKLWFLPAPLVIVAMGIGLNVLFEAVLPSLSLRDHLVAIPPVGELLADMRTPDPGLLSSVAVYKWAVILALVASVETLLSIEAIDKLDPYDRTTPTNRELKAQGLGNVVAGLAGAMPITAVIIRGSTNVQAGARTRFSAFFHGVLLLATVVTIPAVLSMIPIAALAAVLLHVGYRLTPASLHRKMYRAGMGQYAPFLVTCGGVVFTDLLTGVLLGMAVAIVFILKAHVDEPYGIRRKDTLHGAGGCQHVVIELSDNVSFLNKASLSRLLHGFPAGTFIEVDARRTRYIDPDALEVIEDFVAAAPLRGVHTRLLGLVDDPEKSGTRLSLAGAS